MSTYSSCHSYTTFYFVQKISLNTITLQTKIDPTLQVIPKSFMGYGINEAKAQSQMDATKTKRKHVPGLVYHKKQSPQPNDDNNWRLVLDRPALKDWDSKSAFEIITPDGTILVRFLKQNVHTDICQGVKYFVKNNPLVRRTEGESGSMVAMGRRIDYITSEPTHFLSKKPGRDEDQDKTVLDKCVLEFHNLLNRTICKDKLRKDICMLRPYGITMKSRANHSEQFLPTYAASLNLTNSPHQDVLDRSQSYAIFFRDEKSNKGLTWFLFPEYSIAVKVCGTTMVSWNGMAMKHCSLTTSPGIYSLFGSTNDRDLQVSCFEKAFHETNATMVKENDNIVVRKKIRKGDRYIYLLGICLQKDQNSTTVLFASKKNTEVVPNDDIIPVPKIKIFPGFDPSNF